MPRPWLQEAQMGVVEISLSMSLDGFITGPDAGEEQPLGTGGDVLRPGGERWMIDELFAAGRGVYDHVHGWGEEPPFKMPVFVPTHRPREVRVAGATTFTFVTGVESAIAQAKAAAGDKNVYIVGWRQHRGPGAAARLGGRAQPPHRAGAARRWHPVVRRRGPRPDQARADQADRRSEHHPSAVPRAPMTDLAPPTLPRHDGRMTGDGAPRHNIGGS